MQRNTRLKTPQTTFAIVERLVASDGAGVSDLVEELDIPAATVHDHLTTLSQLGYVKKEGQKYNAATEFFRLGENVRRNIDVYEAAKPELAKLSRTTRNQTSLMIEENGTGVSLINIEAPDANEIMKPEGTPTPLHVTASGKVILAYVPEERAHDIIEETVPASSRSQSVPDREGLLSELEQVRSKEFAVDRKESVAGLNSVAAPVFDRDSGRLAGAVRIFGPNSDMHGPERTVLKNLHKTTNIIEKNL